MHLNEYGWVQASLPVKFGRLGVRSAEMLAPAAFLAFASSTFWTSSAASTTQNE